MISKLISIILKDLAHTSDQAINLLSKKIKIGQCHLDIFAIQTHTHNLDIFAIQTYTHNIFFSQYYSD